MKIMIVKGLLGLALYGTQHEYFSKKQIPFEKYQSKHDACLKENEKESEPKKRTWKVDDSMSKLDFFKKHSHEHKHSRKSWNQRYGSYQPRDILRFYQQIKYGFNKPKDTRIKKMNKLLMWINFLHTKSTLSEFSKKWCIKEQTVKNYILDVMMAILISYRNDANIIGVPNHDQQHIMSQILRNTNQDMNNCLLYLDGTHKLCVGRQDKNKRSWKYHWRPAWSHLFVVDRVFGIIVAANVGNPACKHDLTVLRESEFGINFDSLLNDLYFCLGDNAYYNFTKNGFAAMPKKTSINYQLLDSKFMYKHKRCRVTVEHLFAKFFINQNTRLNGWTFKGPNALKLLNSNLICAIILWNQSHIWRLADVVDV